MNPARGRHQVPLCLSILYWWHMTKIQEWYKNILENLHDGVYLVNPERRIEYGNKCAERITS